jgi:hypothetical protein
VNDRVHVKSIGGFIIETHGSIQTRIWEGGIGFPLSFPASKSASGSKRRWDPGM